MRFLKWLLVLGGLFVTPANAAFELGDIICETTSTTGTGTVNLGGAVTNYATFVSQITSGASVPYHIISGDGKLETGIGTFTDAAPDTLTRVANWSTDGSGAELTLSGTSTVCLGPIEQVWDGGVFSPTYADGTFYTASGGALGPVVTINQDSASPASNDAISTITSIGRDSAANVQTWSNIRTEIDTVASANEYSRIEFDIMDRGTLETALTMGAAVADGSFGHSFYAGALNWGQLEVTNTSPGAGGPGFTFYQNSASPAVQDFVGFQAGLGKDDGGNLVNAYAGFNYIILDPTDGTEDGEAQFTAMVNGTLVTSMGISNGVIIGSTSVFPGAGNLRVGSIEVGADTDTTFSRTAAGEVAVEGDAIKHAGRQTIPLTAGAGVVPSGGGIAGCTPVSAFDSGTNDVFLRQCSFSATVDNAIYYYFTFPKSAAETTDLVARVDWTSATGTDTTDDVIWNASAVCFSNDDPINGNAFPADDAVTDTQTAAGDFLSSPEITAITPAGTPAEGDACVLRIRRDADNGSDNFNGTADLIGVQLYYTDNASSDD